tara:strand:+ start:2518 stop:3126 length:609 start_codon:yes stop_codon:yes gene_type:complete
MEAQQLAIFLYVARHTTTLSDGITMEEIGGALDLAQSTVSRNVLKLSERTGINRYTKERDIGLGLLETRIDPNELRRKVVSVTARGQAIHDAMVDYVKPVQSIEDDFETVIYKGVPKRVKSGKGQFRTEFKMNVKELEESLALRRTQSDLEESHKRFLETIARIEGALKVQKKRYADKDFRLATVERAIKRVSETQGSRKRK